MTAGVGWMVFFRFCHRGIAVVSTIVLARLLIPADFGLVALAMSVIGMLELLRAFSFDTVLIQKQDATHADYDTVWTLNQIFTAVIVAMLVALARPAALFYDDARLENVIYLLAFATTVSGVENVGIVNFRKEILFDKEFIFLVGKKLIGFLVTIPIAFALRSYWALVCGIIAMNVGGVILSYTMQPYRPRFSLASAKDIMSFSKWLCINNLLFFLDNRGVDFIVGKLAGAHALGVLTIAYEVSTLPTSDMVQSINRALFPGYAKLSKDIKSLAELYLKTVSFTALFVIPAGAGLALTANLFVPVVLGPSWLEAIPAIQALSVYGILVALQSNGVYIILALGKPRILTLFQVISVIILIPLLIFLTGRYGVIGAAIGQLLGIVLMIPLNYRIISRLLHLKIPSILRVFLRPSVATATMAAACVAAQAYLPKTDNVGVMAAELAFLVCLGVVVYLAAVIIVWRLAGMPAGAESAVLERVPGLARLRRTLI